MCKWQMYQKIGKASFFFCQWKAAFHNPLILGPKCPFHFVWLRIFGLLSYEGFFLLTTKKTNKTFGVDLPFLLSTPPSIFFLFFNFFYPKCPFPSPPPRERVSPQDQAPQGQGDNHHYPRYRERDHRQRRRVWKQGLEKWNKWPEFEEGAARIDAPSRRQRTRGKRTHWRLRSRSWRNRRRGRRRTKCCRRKKTLKRESCNGFWPFLFSCFPKSWRKMAGYYIWKPFALPFTREECKC